MKQTPRKHLRRLKVHSPEGGDENYIDVELSYQKDATPRGLYLHVAPLTAKDGWIRYKAYTGVKIHVLGMKRFSKRTFEQFDVDPEFIVDVVDRVMVSQGLESGWLEEAA